MTDEWDRQRAERLHAAADETDDPADHDELHAAAALLAHDETDRGRAYVERWLAGLMRRYPPPPPG